MEERYYDDMHGDLPEMRDPIRDYYFDKMTRNIWRMVIGCGVVFVAIIVVAVNIVK